MKKEEPAKKRRSSRKQKTSTEALNRLSDVLAHHSDILYAQNRLRRRFLSGVVFGFGSAVGATLLGALVVLIVIRLLEAAGFGQWMQDLPIESFLLER